MLSKTNLRAGVQNFGVNVLGSGSLFTTGTVYYVSSTTGNNDNIGTDPKFPKATIAGATSAATASVGDIVIILPGHAETVTSAITLSKAGVKYVGMGEGLLRPSITGNGTIDAITITAANVTLENIQFPAPGTDNQTADINVAAAGVTIRNTYHIGSTTAKNKTDIITIASGGDDVLIDGVVIYNTVVDVVAGISLEAAVARPTIRNCIIQGTFSSSCLMDEATATLATIENNMFKNTKTTGTTFDFTNNSTGVMRFNHNSGRNTTLASNYALGTGMDYFENRLVEEAALNGGVFPVADSD